MARRVLVPALAVAALALTACPPKYPKCDNDEHCKAEGRNEVCVNGTCQECGQDTDCKEGFVCRENKCVPKPECTTNGDCPAGQRCRNDKCVPECGADSDCPRGMKCSDSRCVPGPECSSDADCGAGQRCDANQKCVTADAGCSLQTVHFDFNESSLTGEARSVLDKNADCMRKGGKGSITIEGHADERGTEEYNLHLGERRANSVKKYLTALGVDGNKLKTVSYGEERPVNNAQNEAAWAQNRRAEFTEK